MNILFFVESGHGNSALLIEQLIALHKQHKEVCAILSTKEQEYGLIEKINSLLIPNYILPFFQSQSFFIFYPVLLNISFFIFPIIFFSSLDM